jgi:hypothetical protein
LTIFKRSVALEKELLSSENFESLTNQPASIFDILTGFFTHKDKSVKESAVKVYIYRAYRAYSIEEFR